MFQILFITKMIGQYRAPIAITPYSNIAKKAILTQHI